MRIGIPRFSSTATTTLPIDLLNVVGDLVPQEFNVTCFCVDLTAAKELRKKFPKDIPKADRLLAGLCFPFCGVSAEDSHASRTITMVFDEGEPYRKHFEAALEKRPPSVPERRATLATSSSGD